jgi:hypothetical protein
MSQQPAQSGLTVQNIVSYRQMSETVTALADSVEELTSLVQDTVLQRLTEVEAELMGESNA